MKKELERAGAKVVGWERLKDPPVLKGEKERLRLWDEAGEVGWGLFRQVM